MTVRTKGEGGVIGIFNGGRYSVIPQHIDYSSIIDLGLFKILPHFLTRGLYNAAFQTWRRSRHSLLLIFPFFALLVCSFLRIREGLDLDACEWQFSCWCFC